MNIIINNKVSPLLLLVFVLSFSFIIPTSIYNYYTFLLDSYLLFQRISMVVMAFYVLYNVLKKCNVFFNMKFIILYWTYVILVTFFNEISVFSLIESVLNKIIVLSFISIVIFKDKKSSVHGMWLAFSLLIIINIVISLLFPKGLYIDDANGLCWFFGSKNEITNYLVIHSILSIGMIDLFVPEKIRFKYIIYSNVFIIFNSLISQSSTCLVVGIVMIAGELIYLFKYRESFHLFSLNPKFMILIFLVINILIVFFNFQAAFSSAFESLFNKDMTLTGRVSVWNLAMKQVQEHMVFGLGYEGPAIIRSKIGFSNCHNTLISCLYYGGILGAALFFMYIYSVADHISKNNTWVKLPFTFILIGIMLIFITESRDFQLSTVLALNLLIIISSTGAKKNAIYKVNCKKTNTR